VLAAEDFASVVAAADEREDVNGRWELGGAAHTVTELSELAGSQGATVTLSGWMKDVVAQGLILGSSAVQEFGVAARPLIVA
jgi:hypothetical protein